MNIKILKKFPNWLAALLSIPAALGILSWIGNWLPYSFFWNSPPYGLFIMQILPIFMVLMILIGFIPSVTSMAVIHKTSFAKWIKGAFYILNGIWIILSLFAFTLTVFRINHP